MQVDLPTVWAALIAFAVLAYVVLDGFDLGIGILFPFESDRRDKDIMMNAIAPIWDGNETWLVLGGGALMAVFPVAYATVLPALYIPLILMLLGLVFRGVSFEFRFRTERWRKVWDHGFGIGSWVAALMQGVALGALVQGIRVAGRHYAGGWWDWLTPFSVLTAIALTVGYVLLGATWLNLKTHGALQLRMKRMARHALIVLIVLIGAVSLWTPFINQLYFARWFAFPSAIYSIVVPLLVLGAAWLIWSGLREGRHLQPFVGALAIFVLCYAGIGISFYPYILPGAFTIAEAAAPPATLEFLLAGTVILVPIILIYTGYAYWVFRGKVDPEEGYH
jgi:cytochrome d ubiquinol oxidase subunit II